MEGAVKQKAEQPIPAHTGTENGPLMAIVEHFNQLLQWLAVIKND